MRIKNTVLATMSAVLCALMAFAYAHAADEPRKDDSPGCFVFGEDNCVGYHPPKRSDYAKDEMLLLYDNDKPANFADDLMQHYRLSLKDATNLRSVETTMLTVATHGQDPLDLAATINQEQDDVDAAESNLYYTAALDSVPVTKAVAAAYPFNMTDLQVAQQYTQGRGVRIGMIDTPIDIHNPLLNSDKIQRVELTHHGDYRNMQHGTEVASIIVSKDERIGIAPEASLLAIGAFKATKKPGVRQSTSSLVAKALELAIHEKVDILNLSFAGGQDKVVDKLIQKAIDQGIIVVASAGNGGPKAKPAYPAALQKVLAVTAVDKREKLFGKANRGRYIDLSAPGVSILTAAPGGSYNVSSGTSLASAHVTGFLALMMSLNKQGQRPMASDRLVTLLNETAVDLGDKGWDQQYGHGLVNAKRAMLFIK